MNDLISPYEINEMFQKKFEGFDFAQPYLSGEFTGDTKKGHITIGVRTPWYDFKYFVYMKVWFLDGIADYKTVEDVIQTAVGHLNAAVAMQISPDGSKARRLDIEDINKYQDDPEGYISEAEPEVEKPNNRDFDVHVHHDSKWSDDALMDAERVHFLCTCKTCMDLMNRVLEARGENEVVKKKKTKWL